MDLHLLLLEDPTPVNPVTGLIDPVEFDLLKQVMLERYDAAKGRKRAVKAEKRSWDYKKAYDQRSENELTALESRVADLKAKRSKELEDAVTIVKHTTTDADNRFNEIKSGFDGARATLQAYADAGKLSMAQKAFLDQIVQFFEAVGTEHDSEFSKLKMDSEMSATTEKFTNKESLASNYAENLMADYYYGVPEYQAEYKDAYEHRSNVREAIDVAKVAHTDKMAQLESEADAAKAAGNDELVKELLKKMIDVEAQYMDEVFVYEKDLRSADAAIDAAHQKFAALLEDMSSKAEFVVDAISNEVIFQQTGKPMTAEHLYEYAKSEFGGEALKAAYAELDAAKAEYTKWDAMTKDQADAMLADVNRGIDEIGKLNRDLSLAKKQADADEHNAFIAMVDADIAAITKELDDMEAQLDDLHLSIEAEEVSLKTKMVELAGLDPASATYAEDKAVLDAEIEKVQLTIEKYKAEVPSIEAEAGFLKSDLTEANDAKAEVSAKYQAAVEALPVIEAEYAAAKDSILANQLAYSDFIANSETERKAKIEELGHFEDAVEAIDSFATSVSFYSGSITGISISALVSESQKES